VEWETRGERCAVAAGLAAWIVALLMLLTSLPPVRRRCYELFFFTHHLYLLFALLWMYHVISHLHYFVVPMLLFFVDRFLRMLQSARLVRVSAARLHADGVVQLTLPLPPLPAKSDSKLL
jgi:DMSO/TMAO reductase YedYZ heme-binding membrane subunit